MELQTIFCHVAVRLPFPIRTKPGDKLRIAVFRDSEQLIVLDTNIATAFDSLVLIDPASWQHSEATK